MGEKLPELGKIHPEFFKKVIYPRLGTKDPSVIVKPEHGVDFGVVDVGGGRVMVLSTDPFYIAKELGIEKAAWFAVHILASDVAVSGVTAMHDATECGVFGGLYEMASHSNVGMNIYLDKIILQDAVKRTCECFGIDPYSAISEGTLLAIAKKDRAKIVVDALKKEGIPASVVGEVVQKKEGIHIIEKGKKRKLEHPRIDPFWGKFEEYLKKKI